MPLPLFLQRLRQRSTPSVADASPLSSADVEVARVRARRRLVGMVVLVGVGVVGLPWLFETQPRPLASDVQVVSAVPSRSPATSGPAQVIASVTVPIPPAPTELPQAAEEEVEAPASVAKPAVRASAPTVPASRPTPVRVPPTAPPATAKKETPKPVASVDHANSKDAARAKALLEDSKPPVVAKPAVTKPASDPAASTRYVVQIGAFSEASTARDVRLKAERAGVKTYTQEVTTAGGKKIRVRVGPYVNKAEADKAVDTLRKAGMTSALLTL